MRKVTLMISAAALALTGGGIAVAAHHDGGHGKKAPATLAEAQERAGTMFERMDANSDGVINAEDKAAKAAERFAAADADGNGEVTQAEMTAAREARRAERQERRAARQAERFAAMDADNSGGVSEAEMAAAREARQEARGERRGGRDGARAERRGGRDGMRGQRGGKRGGKGMGRAMLRTADTNGDQSVSRAEFDAAVLARFTAADANGDGTVTKEERREARKAARAERRAARTAQ